MDNKNKNLIPWIILIAIPVILIGCAYWIISSFQQSTQRVIQPIGDMTSGLSTQVAEFLHPTPTIIPDPVTIINQIRPLARLETIQYTVEKVITAEIGQNALAGLFGDRLLFVGHGYVIAGVDLSKLRSEDLVYEDGILLVQLPQAEIFVSTLDNEQSYVYDRDTGLLTHGDINLETAARQEAEDQIRRAALEDGILQQAQVNAETYLESLLHELGYSQISFIQPGE
jgi:hypothetical protein